MSIVDELGADGDVRLVCSGDLDYETAERFAERVAKVEASSVSLDFAAVEFIDSTGIRALCTVIDRARERGIEIRVENISEGLYEILDLVGCIEVYGKAAFLGCTDK